jgi:hypothetical protein
MYTILEHIYSCEGLKKSKETYLVQKTKISASAVIKYAGRQFFRDGTLIPLQGLRKPTMMQQLDLLTNTVLGMR